MQPILDIKKGPKILVVNEQPEKTNWNKYLPRPWKKGEIVKVHPNQGGISNNRLYVRVIRKDDQGNWNIPHVTGWSFFNTIKAKNK